VEGISNIVFSLVALKLVGLPGVYIGTFLSVLISYIGKPFYVFNGMYKCSPRRYFLRTGLDFLNVILAYSICFLIREQLLPRMHALVSMAVLFVLMLAIYSALRWLIWHKDRHFKECNRLFIETVNRVLTKQQPAEK